MANSIDIGARLARARFVTAFAIALALLGACRAVNTKQATTTKPATATVSATPIAASGAEVRIASPEGAQVWTAERMNALGAVSVPWSHHETSYSYRGIELSALCGDSIAQRASKDTDRKTWNRIVVAVGRDGYKTIFSAAELRHDWGPTHAYVCFEDGGKPLAAEDGPCRLVVPTDGGGARCVRQLVEIRVIDTSALLE
jgi:hypothetical protein